MEKNNKELAYINFIKAFFSSEFDYGMVYFTRYLLFEYLSNNENKKYSKGNPIPIGTLLPDKFIINKDEESEYLFRDYYRLDLLLDNSFAEKIVLYISPFVFNCNIMFLFIIMVMKA